MNHPYPPDEPFWMDSPIRYAHANPMPTEAGLWRWALKLIKVYAYLLHLLIIGSMIFLALRFPAGWILPAFYILLTLAGLWMARLKKARLVKALRIQARAKEITHADQIGSAIHTAGHPLLSLNQPVVLGLKGSVLSIYSYESADPIVVLPVQTIQSVDPVVFDDEYIPHVGVIDNTAQALQITFLWQGDPYTCSFRHMLEIRAIGWYQAIQQARLSAGR